MHRLIFEYAHSLTILKTHKTWPKSALILLRMRTLSLTQVIGQYAEVKEKQRQTQAYAGDEEAPDRNLWVGFTCVSCLIPVEVVSLNRRTTALSLDPTFGLRTCSARPAVSDSMRTVMMPFRSCSKDRTQLEYTQTNDLKVRSVFLFSSYKDKCALVIPLFPTSLQQCCHLFNELLVGFNLACVSLKLKNPWRHSYLRKGRLQRRENIVGLDCSCVCCCVSVRGRPHATGT